MARYVSKYPQLGLGTAIRERFVLALDGQRDLAPDQRTGWTGSVSVQFSQLGLTMDDIRFAKTRWPEKEFTGRWQSDDGVTLQPIEERIGVYDTDEAARAESWTPEVKEFVEAWIAAKPNHGVDFALVEKVAAPRPWNTYDSTHHNKIPVLAIELDCVDAVLAYERENKNRSSVILAVEEAARKSAPVPADGELVEA